MYFVVIVVVKLWNRKLVASALNFALLYFSPSLSPKMALSSADSCHLIHTLTHTSHTHRHLSCDECVHNNKKKKQKQTKLMFDSVVNFVALHNLRFTILDILDWPINRSLALSLSLSPLSQHSNSPLPIQIPMR